MLLQQILKDLRKEWSWTIFYAVVATMTAMAILYLSISFSAVQSQSSSIRSFVDRNVVMFEFFSTEMEPAPLESEASEDQESFPIDVQAYLQETLSAEGKAGSFVFVGNDGYVDEKYDQLLILFGQYSDLVGVEYDAPMAVFVPETQKEDVGNQLTVAGHQMEIEGTIPSDFRLFHPKFYLEPGNPLFSSMLILCTRDFQTVHRMFPWWRLNTEVFDRMVLVNPTDAEIDQLQRVFYDQYGQIYTGISTKEFTQTTTIASMRAHRLYMWFYILSGILLILLLLFNMIRIIEVHVADYTVHHLYGAPIRFLQRRVGGFTLALNFLPIVGISYVLAVNKMALWYYLLFMLALVLGLYVFVAVYVRKRIGSLNSLENLRRDY